MLKEKNYFFRMSDFEQQLLDLYETSPTSCSPRACATRSSSSSSRGSTTCRSRGRASTGASRCRGTTRHVVYVWFDALLNYVTAVGYGVDDEQFERRWPAVPPGRQRHRPLPRRHLAGHADGRRAAGAAARSSATAGCWSAARRCRKSKLTGIAPAADHRHLRLGRVPLLLPARDHLRPGRLVQLGRPVGPLPGRARQRFRQPRVARGRDGRRATSTACVPAAGEYADADLAIQRTVAEAAADAPMPRSSASRSTRRSPRSGRSSTSSTATSPSRSRGCSPRTTADPRPPRHGALHGVRGSARARRAAQPGHPEGDREAVGCARAPRRPSARSTEQPHPRGGRAGAAARRRRSSDARARCSRASKSPRPERRDRAVPASARGSGPRIRPGTTRRSRRRSSCRSTTTTRTSRSPDGDRPRSTTASSSTAPPASACAASCRSAPTSRPRGGAPRSPSHEPRVLAAVALHPNEAPELRAAGQLDEHLAEIDELAARPRVRAIGETGLDFFRTRTRRGSARSTARSRRTSRSPSSSNLALQIHDRDAHAEVVETLRRVGAPERTVFHCFSGDAEFAQARRRTRLVPLVRRHRHVQERRAACARRSRSIPRSRILIETDAPYLTPTPFRGRPNSPYLIPHTLRAMAAHLGTDVSMLAAQISLEHRARLRPLGRRAGRRRRPGRSIRRRLTTATEHPMSAARARRRSATSPTLLDLQPTKKLGQNFVVDGNTVRKIVRTAGRRAGRRRCSRSARGSARSRSACSRRARASPRSRSTTRLAAQLPLTVEATRTRAPTAHGDHRGRAARRRRCRARPTRLVANLPYNVSVPVLLHLLRHGAVARDRARDGAGRGRAAARGRARARRSTARRA